MIKVIKENVDRITKCGYCGSMLEYDVEDMKERKNVLKDEEIAYIVCPACGNNTIVPPVSINELRQLWWQLIGNEKRKDNHNE